MVLLNNITLIQTSVAALLVIGGVVAKNSSQQLELTDKTVEYIGTAMFVGGWLLSAYVLSYGKENKYLYILPCFGVLIAVMIMKMEIKKFKFLSMILPGLFIISWILIGYNVGNHIPSSLKYSGLMASALVIVSMMKALPYQRLHNNVDGPGTYLFMLAWLIIILLNSMSK